MSVKTALDEIRAAMQADPHFAWVWHCNIAMAAYDEGLEHLAANRAAARFMLSAFEVDTSECPGADERNKEALDAEEFVVSADGAMERK